MDLNELSKQYNDLSQRRANLKYRKSELQEQLAANDLELAKVDGKLELLEALAQAETADRGQGTADQKPEAESVRSPQSGAPSGPRSRKRSANGVIIPDPEPEEEEAA